MIYMALYICRTKTSCPGTEEAKEHLSESQVIAMCHIGTS